jgi:hypothetical protein
VASPSSISSSEPLVSEVSRARRNARARAPWGLATAAGMLLALELVLRVLHPPGVLPSTLDDELCYLGVVPELLAYGAPDIAVVGSSRARRAVNSPEIAAAFGSEQRPRVGNFGLGAAKAEDTEVTIRRLLEANPAPKLVIWPIAPHDLVSRGEQPGPWVRYLWRVSDWREARQRLGGRADRYLPEALRNEAARHLRLVRYRGPVRNLIEGSQRRHLLSNLTDLLLGRTQPTPLHGAIHPMNLKGDGTAMKEVSRKRIRRYIGRRSYRDPRWPNNEQAASVERAIELLARRGVRLVFFELPAHPLMEEMLPSGTTKKYRKLMKTLEKRHGVPFFRISDLDEQFSALDFVEQSHVNGMGAKKFTKAISGPVVKILR